MITVVSGLGRCGSSLMMAMLKAGGVPIFGDQSYAFESDQACLLPGDSAWMDDCHGKVVKVLDPHKFRLPKRYEYRIIWMQRDAKEQAKSQIKFLHAFWPDLPANQKDWTRAIMPDTRECLRLFDSLDAEVFRVQFEELLHDPIKTARQVAKFLERPMDIELMVKEVVPREPSCLPYLLELTRLCGTATELSRQ